MAGEIGEKNPLFLLIPDVSSAVKVHVAVSVQVADHQRAVVLATSGTGSDLEGQLETVGAVNLKSEICRHHKDTCSLHNLTSSALRCTPFHVFPDMFRLKMEYFLTVPRLLA